MMKKILTLLLATVLVSVSFARDGRFYSRPVYHSNIVVGGPHFAVRAYAPVRYYAPSPYYYAPRPYYNNYAARPYIAARPYFHRERFVYGRHW